MYECYGPKLKSQLKAMLPQHVEDSPYKSPMKSFGSSLATTVVAPSRSMSVDNLRQQRQMRMSKFEKSDRVKARQLLQSKQLFENSNNLNKYFIHIQNLIDEYLSALTLIVKFRNDKKLQDFIEDLFQSSCFGDLVRTLVQTNFQQKKSDSEIAAFLKKRIGQQQQTQGLKNYLQKILKILIAQKEYNRDYQLKNISKSQGIRFLIKKFIMFVVDDEGKMESQEMKKILDQANFFNFTNLTQMQQIEQKIPRQGIFIHKHTRNTVMDYYQLFIFNSQWVFISFPMNQQNKQSQAPLKMTSSVFPIREKDQYLEGQSFQQLKKLLSNAFFIDFGTQFHEQIVGQLKMVALGYSVASLQQKYIQNYLNKILNSQSQTKSLILSLVDKNLTNRTLDSIDCSIQ